jgi:DNA-binding MarR family transcriptional regulator
VPDPQRSGRAPVQEPGGAWVDELGLTGEVGLVTRVARLNLFVSRLLESLSARADLTAADYLVVAVVCRSPGRQASPARMADLLGRSTGGLSLTIDRLVAEGLLERSRHPDDGRRTVVTATPEGYRRWQVVSRALRKVEQRLPLDDTERSATAAVLDDLIARFERGQLEAD